MAAGGGGGGDAGSAAEGCGLTGSSRGVEAGLGARFFMPGPDHKAEENAREKESFLFS